MVSRDPTEAEIDDVVAEDDWEYDLEGTKRTSHIVVGRPRPFPKGPKAPKGDWYCPIFFEHFTPEPIHIGGVGPVSALVNAVDYIRRRYHELANVRPGARRRTRSRLPKR